jgi:selenide,water dikinase
VLGAIKQPTNKDMLVGFEGAEDAGVLRIAPDRALVFTTDFFPPMIDDPYAFGQVAAANALSDVFAMGGRVLAALNLVGFPKQLDLAILGRILEGSADKVVEAGGAVAGGHTVEDAEIKFGLAVTGEIHPDLIVRNRGARPGDALVLTKPIGTGLITSSVKTRKNDGPEVQEAIRWMTTLNATGLEAIMATGPHAMTDITGFGLLGHLAEMVAQDPIRAILSFESIPLIPGVEKCFKRNCRTRGKETNRAYVGERLAFDGNFSEWDDELLLDPQTSGGLLVAVPAEKASGLVADLRSGGLELTAVIGTVEASPSAQILVRR